PQVPFHCWAAESLAGLVLLDVKELRPGSRAFAQLRLKEPCLYLSGDRFIIRQFSPVVTIGGGVVLDGQPPKHRFGDPQVRESLEVLERGDAEARLRLLTAQSGEISLSALVMRTGWQSSEVLRVGEVMGGKGKLVMVGQPTRWLSLYH